MARVFLITLFFCSSAIAEPLFELRVGASWTYVVSGNEEYIVTNRIMEQRSAQGITWFRLSEYGDTFWIRNSKQGQVEAVDLFNSDFDPAQARNEGLIFKFPANAGDQWNMDFSPTTYRGIRTTKVPAGSFSCHEYFIDMGNGSYSLSCIAEGLGVIYNETVFEDSSREVSRLLRYETGL